MGDNVINSTDFYFPGQTGLYHGKVRDVYTIRDHFLVSVATDRISGFNVALPRAIPYKGQVLNQLAAHFLEATNDIIPNWLLNVPDPNASLGNKAEPLPISMVIRDSLIGSSWRDYRNGERQICGVALPEELDEYDRLPEPIITPTTKSKTGRDKNICQDEILERGLLRADQWQQLCGFTQLLFSRGREMAAERGLVLADTKYEFGILDGRIILIDEIHTPDSSRYFYKDSYEKYLSGEKSEAPAHLSKEFVREWLLTAGFSGQSGQPAPVMDDEFVHSVSDRYIELYETLTGKQFEPASYSGALERIEAAVSDALDQF